MLDDGMIIFGTLNGAVRAVIDNGATRTVAWTHPTWGAIYASPIVTRDGKVLIGSTDGTFYALNVADGGVLWSKVTFGAIYSTASLDGLGGVAFGSDDGSLYLLAP
jgi:outer membrane protein assembly factor BamB